MRLAILHNFLDNIGGAERVTLTLASELEADVITTVADHGMITKMGFDTTVREIGWLPKNPPWRQQLAAWRFRWLNLSKNYDAFIIAGDWALSAAMLNKPALWYCHTPSRELWDLKNYTRQHIVPPHKRLLFDGWVAYNRILNKSYIKQVAAVIASSKTAERRLSRYLGIEANVVYPPVPVEDFYYEKNGDFWLSVNRLVSYKRIELQLEAFRQMPDQKLIIVGSYEQARHFKNHANYLKKIAPANVTFKHWVGRDELIKLYATCRGFLTTSYQEDFGLTAVEAMAAGKPVIAPAEGGYLETVVDGKTGRLLKKTTVSNIVAATQQLGGDSAPFRAACQERAQLFRVERSVRQLQAALRDLVDG